MLSVSFREKHLLTRTSRSRFHPQMFNHNNKYPRYKKTSDHQTNFLTEKVIEPRSLHLYQRYLSFDILNHSLGTTFDRILFIRELIPIILLPTIYLIDTLFHL